MQSTSSFLLFISFLTFTTVGYPGKKTDEPLDLISPAHVPEGCFPDAVHYIRELSKVQPAMNAEILTVEVSDARGHYRHIFTLVTAPGGSLFARDEFYGAMPLRYVHAGSPKDRICQEAVEAFDRRTRWLRQVGQKKVTEERHIDVQGPSDYIEAIKTLKTILPDARIYTVGQKAVALWHMSDTVVCFYNPEFGTETLVRQLPKPGDPVITDDTLANALAKKSGYGPAVPFKETSN